MNEEEFVHEPVLLKESLAFLEPGQGRIYLDATVGLGGHFLEIAAALRKSCEARQESGLSAPVLLGIDKDARALAITAEKLKAKGFDFKSPRIFLEQGNFADIQSICAGLGIDSIDGGILADIGVSSMQLDDPQRGFSFMADGPLDMRMDSSKGKSAAEFLNELSEKELADIFYRYGEERLSRPIARKVVAARPVLRSSQFAQLISQVYGKAKGYRRGADKSHPATRCFQALRIAVNDELLALEKFLKACIEILAPGARLVVISFHSLEDRLVKQIFKSWESPCICPPRQPLCTCSKQRLFKILSKKPLQADNKETLANPRSRSAKLRAGERVNGEV